MAEGKGKTSEKTIEGLLAERTQFQLWLSRLDDNSDLASEGVREKIRGDYQVRLEGVLNELRSHEEGIAEQLADHRVSQADLTAQESTAKDELAEAEVRHAVGEFEDDEWETLKSGSEEQLEKIQDQLAEVTEEINRLVMVQADIAVPATVGEEESGGEDTAAEADVIAFSSKGTDEPTDDGASEVGAPKFTPRGADAGSPSATPRTLRFPSDTAGAEGLDELDFLKSVTEDESSGPSAARASGEFSQAHPGAAVDQPARAPETTVTDDAGAAASPTQAKTLKCGECGELNRPTEWYCERCGAELASL